MNSATEKFLVQEGVPHNLEAERAILGAIMLDNLAFTEAAMVQPEEFYLDAHQKLFIAMSTIIRNDGKVDMISLMERLRRKKGRIESIGGVAYIASLTDGLPRRPSIEQYCNIVRDKALLRRLLNLGISLSDRAAHDENANAIIGDVENEIISMLNRTGRRVPPVSEAVSELIQKMVSIRLGKKIADARTTSLKEVDTLTKGVRDSEYVILAARTGHGKSSFMAQMALANAKLGKRIGIWSFEMTRENLIERMIAAESGIDYNDVRSPEFLTTAELDKIADAGKLISELPLHIDDGVYQCPELLARMRAQIMQGMELGFVDYLQIVPYKQHRETYDRVTAISGGLRDLAKTTKVPTIALSQIKRPEQGGENKEPTIFDLKECGNIENDAFQVWLLFRPKEKNEDERWMFNGRDWFIVGKNRNGPQGSIPITYDGPRLTFKPRVVEREEPKPKTPKTQPVMPPAQRSFYDKDEEN